VIKVVRPFKLDKNGEPVDTWPDLQTMAATLSRAKAFTRLDRITQVPFVRPMEASRQPAAQHGASCSRRRSPGRTWAVDRQLRDALVSGPVTPGCRARGPPKSTAALEPAATTIHTRCGCWPGAWVYVIWRCWQDGVAYDRARHGGAQRYGSASSPTAA
jgi:hypothetical protein